MFIKMTKKTAVGAIMIMTGLLALPATSHAVLVPMLTSGTGGSLRDDFNGVGIEFTVGAADLKVTAVGTWDYLGDNQAPYNIPITLTGFGPFTLPADPTHTLTYDIGEFRYVNITPVTLLAGHTYDLKAVYSVGGGEQWQNFGPVSSSIFNSLPLITSYGAIYDGSGGIAAFSWSLGTPNLLVSEVPEPSTVGLLAAASLVLLWRRSR